MVQTLLTSAFVWWKDDIDKVALSSVAEARVM